LTGVNPIGHQLDWGFGCTQSYTLSDTLAPCVARLADAGSIILKIAIFRTMMTSLELECVSRQGNYVIYQ